MNGKKDKLLAVYVPWWIMICYVNQELMKIRKYKMKETHRNKKNTKTKKQDLERLAASPDPNDQKAAQLVLNNSPLEAWKVLEKEETAY